MNITDFSKIFGCTALVVALSGCAGASTTSDEPTPVESAVSTPTPEPVETYQWDCSDKTRPMPEDTATQEFVCEVEETKPTTPPTPTPKPSPTQAVDDGPESGLWSLVTEPVADPAALPCADLTIDVVVDSNGREGVICKDNGYALTLSGDLSLNPGQNMLVNYQTNFVGDSTIEYAERQDGHHAFVVLSPGQKIFVYTVNPDNKTTVRQITDRSEAHITDGRVQLREDLDSDVY